MATTLPKLEYGCQAYCTAARTTLEQLDPVHNQAIRICLGAFCSSPEISLHAESNLGSLEDRRKSICLKYLVRTMAQDKSTLYVI